MCWERGICEVTRPKSHVEIWCRVVQRVGGDFRPLSPWLGGLQEKKKEKKEREKNIENIVFSFFFFCPFSFKKKRVRLLIELIELIKLCVDPAPKVSSWRGGPDTKFEKVDKFNGG